MKDPLEPYINEDGKAYNDGNPIARWAPWVFVFIFIVILFS